MNIARAISQMFFWCRSFRYGQALLRIAACAVVAAVFSSPHLAEATTVPTAVRMETNLGAIDIELYDSLAPIPVPAPITVANFLNYAGRGDYNGTIIHRSAPGFVIQGGGYKCCNSLGQFYLIPSDPPIQNEFDPSRPNVRGTIAMAKVGNDPNSATSEWFFNLADNSANLDYQNGGFTVFGRVLGSGMKVVDTIAALQRYNFGAPFDTLPLINYDPTVNLQAQLSNLVTVTNISKAAFTSTIWGTLATFTADVDMVFDQLQTVDTNTALTWLTSFTSPPDQSVQFNNGIHTMKMSGVMGAGRVVTLYDGAAVRPTRYYAYGKTLDNPTDHWYDFTYDGETGAEISGGKILLHFVDGQRGDDDLDSTNNSISHTGAQAVVTEVNNGSASGGGCSIAGTPPDAKHGGDWIVVSLFLTTLALVRRRTRSKQNQNT